MEVAKRTATPLGEELPQLAAERGLSVRKVAHQVGVSQAHLSRVVLGKIPASGQLAGRIAETLGLPKDYFAEYRSWRLAEALRADPGLRDRLFDKYGRERPSRPTR
jgi:transcriptional regulator with XRE-family HTH domain